VSIRTSIILVVSLAMVAGYVFFVQIRQTPEVQDNPPWFYNLDMLDMTRIAITDQEEETVFFLGEDNHWYIDEPQGLPVGLDRWSGITLLLSGPVSRRLLDAQPTDLKPYGLDLPPTSIEVDLKDGQTIKVLLGFPTPDGEGTYAQVQGFPQVFTIFGGWGDVMTRLVAEPPYPEWYYNIDLATLTGVEMWTQEKAIALTKDDAGWHFIDEEESPVDETQLPTLFASLAQPSQTLVEYDAADLAQYGLDTPSRSLILLLQTEILREDGITVVSQPIFYIGSPTEDGTGYYVQTERTKLIPDIFVVNAEWVEGLQAIVANPPYLGDAAPGS